LYSYANTSYVSHMSYHDFVQRKAQERELTGVGGGNPRDAWWRSELLPDGYETRGKTSTRVWGASPPKESSNGRVAQRLASDERWRCSPWLGGRNGERGDISHRRCLYGRRRERRFGWALWVGDGHRRRAGVSDRGRALGSPTSGGWRVGPGSVFESGVSQFGLTGTL
jgi:hypothetical protein